MPYKHARPMALALGLGAALLLTAAWCRPEGLRRAIPQQTADLPGHDRDKTDRDETAPEQTVDAWVSPGAYGASADGNLHPITPGNIEAHPEWIGRYAPGDQWDYVALQEAIYHAFYNGTLTPNASNRGRNKPLHIPSGTYLVNKPLSVVKLQGGEISGAGRLTTTIRSISSCPAFQTDGMWYTRIEGIRFQGSRAYDGALFELDGNVSPNTHGVQGNTIENCYFDGAGVVSYGLAIARQGGSRAQGSENLFLNDHFVNAVQAGLLVNGYNALQNTIVGGNFQNCLPYGVRVQAGSVNVYSVGFQDGTTTQIDRDGFDIAIFNSADDHSSVFNCRSESARLLFATNGHHVLVSNNTLLPSFELSQWSAYMECKPGQLVIGKSDGNGNGKLYLVVEGGRTDATEPAWGPNARYGNAGKALKGSKILLSGSAAPRPSEVGANIVVEGAGERGADLYTKVQAVGTDRSLILNDAALTSNDNALYRFGSATVSGTVKFIEYDYYELVADSFELSNNTFKYGRILTSQKDAQRAAAIVNNTFARVDWLDSSLPTTPGNGLIVTGNVVRKNGGLNTGGRPLSYSLPGDAGVHNNVFAVGDSALLITGSTSGPVGLERSSQTYQNDSTSPGDSKEIRNILGVLGALGKPTPSGTDQPGSNLYVTGGLPTGTGRPGTINLRVANQGVAGSAAPDSTDRLIVGSRKHLIRSSDTVPLFEISLPALSAASGVLTYSIYANDARDIQVESGIVRYSALNANGAYFTSDISDVSHGLSASRGTLTAKFELKPGKDRVIMLVTPASSLTPTSFFITFTLENNSERPITIL